MTDEVERIEVPVQFGGHLFKRQAPGIQLVEYGLLGFGGVPALQEVVEAGESLPQRLLREVAQGLGDELAVLVQVFHAFGDDGRGDAVHVDFLRTASGTRRVGVGPVVENRSVVAILSPSIPDHVVVRRSDRVVLAGLVSGLGTYQYGACARSRRRSSKARVSRRAPSVRTISAACALR